MINKNFIYYLLLSALLAPQKIAYAEGNKMNIFNNQPFYTVQIESYATKHDVSINGVSILRDYDDEGKSNTTFPINHLVKNGTNKIELNVLPSKPADLLNTNSSISLTLKVHSNDNPDENHILASIVFSGGDSNYITNSSQSGKYKLENNLVLSEEGEIHVNDITTNKIHNYAGGINFTRNINFPTPFPLWGFFEGDELPNYDAMSDDEYYSEVEILLNEYMKIQTAIANNNFDSINALLDERNTELDIAYYKPIGSSSKKIITSLKEAANDDGLELVGLKKDYVNFSVEDNNKVASLKRAHQKPAIVLNFKAGEGSQFYQFLFRKKNNKWILTR